MRVSAHPYDIDPYDTAPLEIDPLGPVLAAVLRTPGATAACAVDSLRGLILAAVGRTGDDDVVALVQLARAAAQVAAREDGLDDTVVTTRRSVHVLRECAAPGTFLHVRLDRERGDVAAARRALHAAGLQEAVRSLPPGLPPPLPGLPLPSPRRPPVGVSGEQQPALVTLAGMVLPSSTGALAVLALQQVDPPRDPEVSLPRRRPSPYPRAAPAAGDGVLQQEWTRDVDALQRVLDGLRRLS